ncbi:NAD(P)/FAD-dependent oxidoreductase [Halobacillus karajensis]|uniref:Hydrogen cyanide synthase subunit HcnC n=1 Tax=Halobacillus karajensis TaxID=195088 RepID=A0A024P157_9BACI|nr:FAD-dependent oxidoreductase [Halobacillus karajensis]CDQ19412.1 Hydrogen cyanide synthase subunit HcnC precursor [Halobacillus karajensis]CDQ21875.1 Hydrogen cyanide synthase subunit HcnC precursor [Halobacillus karajensis]CDQ27715.1 Hydrogen cyanide synthase subunit HcnC precursor [Halobacillus karajensis]
MKHIIIGAGILGASTAYHLAKKGEEVLVVDRHDPAQATRNAAGIVCPWLTNRSNKAWYHLVTRGAKYYPHLMEELSQYGETETGYKQVGAINIFDTEEKLDKKMNVAYKRKQENPEMGEITKLYPEETKKLFPPVADHYHAVHISGAARVNGGAMAASLLRAAQKLGAHLKQGEAALVMEKDRIDGVSVGGENFFSDHIIITNGAWARELFTPTALTPNITFEKAQIIHLEMNEYDTGSWPVMLPPFNHYILAFSKGRVVVGATKESVADTRVTAGAVHQLMDKALRVAPGLADATYIGTKVGYRPYTPGSLPVIGRVPGNDHVWMANGLGASGLTSGPYVGSELAKCVRDEQTTISLEDYQSDELFK